LGTGHDIDNTSDAYETGLKIFVDLCKPDFLNKAHLEDGECQVDIAGKRCPLQESLASRAM